MPTYLYKCPVCAHKREVVKSIAQIDSVEECSHCSFAMNRQICAPAVRGDYAGYACPVTGNWIEGRVAHEENLRRTGCRVLEDGEREASARTRREQEESFLESVAETAAAEVHNLPSAKRDKLCAELEGGMGLSVERSTPKLA